MDPGELVIRKGEGRITFDRLIEQTNSLELALVSGRTEQSGGDERLGLCVQIVSGEIVGWSLLHGQLFACRECRSKSICE